ncbi:hypothetical protein Tco_0305902, partial [Tanacetum coccineum]
MCVESPSCNPSLALFLSSSQPLMGFGLSEMNWKGGIRVGVEWGKVRDSCRGVLERWFGAETMEVSGLGFGGIGGL